MATALIHFDPQQIARLARRAKQRGRFFSQEVRNAVDKYLDIPVESEEELKVWRARPNSPPIAASRNWTKRSPTLTAF